MSTHDDFTAIEAAMVRARRSFTRHTLARRAAAENAARFDVGVAQVVDAVEQGPATVGDVAERLGIDPSRASRLVARGAAAGVVRRVADQSDARRIVLELTAAGHQLADQMHDSRRRAFGAAMQDWTDAERRDFARLLVRFVDGLGR